MDTTTVTNNPARILRLSAMRLNLLMGVTAVAMLPGTGVQARTWTSANRILSIPVC